MTFSFPHSPLLVLAIGPQWASDHRREMSVVAARDIAEGEAVMSFPPSMFISSGGTARDVMPFDVDQVGGREGVRDGSEG